MDTYINQLSGYLFAQSWQIAILTVVIALVTLALRNKSAHIRYLLWMIILAKCLVPPLFSVPVAVLPEQPHSESSMVPVFYEAPPYRPAEIVSNELIINEEKVEPLQEKSKPLSTKEIVVLVWLAGVVLFLIWITSRVVRYTLWLHSRRKPLSPVVYKSFRELFSQFKRKKPPKIWLTKDIAQPFVWGLFRGSIYLPVDFADSANQKHKTTILAHELSHVTRFDAGINVLQVAAQAIYWFHPFVWWVNRKIRQEREKCCDEMAVVQLNTLPEHYTSAIVETLAAERRSAHHIPSLAIVGSVKDIEERIKTIMKPQKKFYRKPNLKVAVTVLLFASLIIPTTFVLTARGATGRNAVISDNNDMQPAPTDSNISPTPKLDNPEDWVPQVNGCLIEQTGSKIHIIGTTNMEGWGHWNGIEFTKVLPKGDFYACVDFMVPRFSGTGNALVYLRAKSATGNSRMVAILFQPNAGVYQVQGWSKDGNIFGGMLRNFGDEDKEYHRMKLKYDAAAKTAFGWIDDKFIGYLNYPLTDSIKFDLLANTETRGMQIDLFFDNLLVSPDISEAPPVPASASLLVAVASGDIEKVKLLISEKIDQDAKNKALQEACSEGHLDIVKLLVDNGADINASDQNRDTPLGFAVVGGHLKVAEFLIIQGADVNAINNAGLTPLDVATQSDHTEIVELLLKHGAKKTLSWFVAIGDIEQVKLLILEETNPNAKNAALQEACYVDNLDIMKLLIDNGADVNAKNKGGGTALTTATAGGNKEMIELLIEKGADINASNNWGWTALLSTASNGYIDILELLIAKGADINAQVARTGQTAVELAEQEGHIEIVELLRKHGAKEKSSSGENSTDTTDALCKAAAAGDIKLVQSLISQGANINEVNNRGYAALHTASTNARKDVVELLIEKGTNINVQNSIGNTPLHLAVGRGHEDVITLLLNSGADINLKNNSGHIPLMDAVSSGNKSVVELLILKGADINAKNNIGFTSLDMAENRGYSEIVELLKKHGAED